MTEENKKRVKNEIAKDKSWVVIDGILGDEVSALVWGKAVEIIYQDMDSRPCMCHAICVYKPFTGPYFIAADGPAKGNRMTGVIAYRPLKEQNDET